MRSLCFWRAGGKVYRFVTLTASLSMKDTVSCKNKFQELVDGGIQKAVRDEGNLVLLPKQMWCSLRGSENGETCCEVGWLIDRGSGVTSRCNFTGEAKLKEISISHETAIL